MPQAVGALGSIAGGLAAKAITGGDKKAPAGGGIAGLTSSQGSGKDGSKGSVVQVDPTIAIDYFKQAADANAANELKGLNYYSAAVSQAIKTVQNSTIEANSTLKPLSAASNQALNQQLRMLGMQPIQATANSAAEFGSLTSNLAGLNATQQAQAKTIQAQMNSAANISDPVQRENTLNQLTQQMSNLTSGGVSDYQSQIAKAQTALQQAQANQTGWSNQRLATAAADRTGASRQMDINEVNKYNPYNSAVSTAKSKLDTLNQSLQQQQDAQSQINAYRDTYSSQYNQGYDAAYTGDQAAAVIKSTPGYQFQFDQGNQALQRQQAAAGMLQSGNAMTAAVKYGQDFGMGYFDKYMQQLNNTVNQGAGATGQIASNQNQAGQNIAALQQGLGQQGADTYSRIGQYTGNTLIRSGDVFQQAALVNMAAQNKSAGDTQAGQLQAAMFNAQQNSKAAASAQQGAGGLLGSR